MEQNQPNVVHLAWRRSDDAGLEQLVSSIASGIGQLEKENHELKERNAGLERALWQSNERLNQLENSLGGTVDASRSALALVAQALDHAADAVDGGGRTQLDEAQRYADAAKRVLELQKEVLGLLEKARADISQRDREEEHRALLILREARRSVLSVIDDLTGIAPERNIARSNGHHDHESNESAAKVPAPQSLPNEANLAAASAPRFTLG